MASKEIHIKEGERIPDIIEMDPDSIKFVGTGDSDSQNCDSTAIESMLNVLKKNAPVLTPAVDASSKLYSTLECKLQQTPDALLAVPITTQIGKLALKVNEFANSLSEISIVDNLTHDTVLVVAISLTGHELVENLHKVYEKFIVGEGKDTKQ